MTRLLLNSNSIPYFENTGDVPLNAGMGKVRPAGRMPPSDSFCAALLKNIQCAALSKVLRHLKISNLSFRKYKSG